MNVFIFTEAGNGIGLGHLTRCLSVYEAFEEKNLIPQIIVKSDINLESILTDKNYSNLDWIKNLESILNIVSENDVVIIDSYLADIEIYQKISDKVKLFAFFDDYNRLKYPKGFLINGSIFANEIEYEKNENIEYILGLDYIPIRKEFCVNENKLIKKNIESILIIFGGNDIKNLTPIVLNKLCSEFPNITKNVIVNTSFNNLDQIKTISDSKTNIIFSPTVKELKKIIFESDTAISAAGQTLYELAVIGTPTIMVSVADNQENNVLGWLKTDIIDFAGYYNDVLLIKNIVELIYKLSSIGIRTIKSHKSKKIIKNTGSIMIVNKILKNK